MNIGEIGYSGATNNTCINLIKQAIERETERKQREVLLESFGVRVEDEYTQRNPYQFIIDMINTGQEVLEFQNAIKETMESIPQEQTIERLKKKIKYSKNPLEVKSLNRQLNKIYKARKMSSKL